MLIDAYSVFAIAIMNSGAVKTKDIKSDSPIGADFLSRLIETINNLISNKLLNEIKNKDILGLYEQLSEQTELIKHILEFVSECLDDNYNYSDVYLGGTTNILNYPEYSNITKARQLLEFLEDKSNIKKMFTPLSDKKQIQILIGSENAADEMKDCSIVLSQYHIKDKQYGAIGIIGPTRMDYSRVVSMLEYFTNQLKSNLEEENE